MLSREIVEQETIWAAVEVAADLIRLRNDLSPSSDLHLLLNDVIEATQALLDYCDGDEGLSDLAA